MTKHTNTELREMMERATPGPWETDIDTATGLVDVVDDHGDGIADAMVSENARLIAAMHTELPRLLAESEELERILEDLEKTLDQHQGDARVSGQVMYSLELRRFRKHVKP